MDVPQLDFFHNMHNRSVTAVLVTVSGLVCESSASYSNRSVRAVLVTVTDLSEQC